MESSRRARQLWLATVTLASLCFALLIVKPLHAQQQPRQKTESPYFFVKSDDPSVDRLPLKRTAVDVKIAGVITDARVTQTYRNEGTRPIEASYVFPGSTRACSTSAWSASRSNRA